MKHNVRWSVAAACWLSWGMLGCGGLVTPPTDHAEPPPMAGVSYALTSTNGLSNAERKLYYRADEGIQYLPVDVLRALNRPVLNKKGLPKLYDQRLLQKPERFGLYPSPFSDDPLPLGISVSTDPSYVPMAGLTCATCHTSVMVYDKHAYVVDGGAAHFAISRFAEEMIISVIATTLTPGEPRRVYNAYKKAAAARDEADEAAVEDLMADDAFERYSAAAAAFTSGGRANFETEAVRYLARAEASLTGLDGSALDQIDHASHPRPSDLDTFGEFYVYLVKRAVYLARQARYGDDSPSTGMGRSNPWLIVRNMLDANRSHLALPELNAADTKINPHGAINTAHIFDYGKQKWVFWTGVTNSMMARNLAQGVALLTDFDWKRYRTTVSVGRLHEVNAEAQRIVAPRWPDAFPAPDAALAAQGKVVFEQHCLGCHSALNADPAQGQTVLRYCDVDTDNHYYAGQAPAFGGSSLFQEVLPAFIGRVAEVAYEQEGLAGQEASFEVGRHPGVWREPDPNAFVAKPLHGIWATAPYLHNGSVRTLHELLKAPDEREPKFWVGSVEYDPVELGFRSEELYNATLLDVSAPGNSNQGHPYGAVLSDAERLQVLEFLKTYSDDTVFGGAVQTALLSSNCYDPDN